MKNSKRFATLVMLTMTVTFFLAGCVPQKMSSHPKVPTGLIYGSSYKYIAVPLQHIMERIADVFGGINGYGWAIIIITFVVRMILLPLMLNQSNKMTAQQEKTRRLKPQLDIIQEQQKAATTPEEKAELSQLMMKVYKENDSSMMPSLGCLTLLIQLPIFSGLYQAIQYSPEISSSHFFGIGLGSPNIIITVIATLLYVGQSALSLVGMPAEQKKQMQTTVLMSPAITFFISLFAPAGLALYFLAGGIIMVIQQLITTFIIMPRVKKRIDQEIKEKPIVTVVTKEMFTQKATVKPAADVTETPTETSNPTVATPKVAGKRNSGKQRHKPQA